MQKSKRKIVAIASALCAMSFVAASVGLVSNNVFAAGVSATFVQTDATTGAAWEGVYGKQGYVVIGNTAKGFYSDMYDGNDGKTEVVGGWEYNKPYTATTLTPKESAPISRWDVGATVWGSNNTASAAKINQPGTNEVLKDARLHNGWNNAYQDVSVMFTLKTDDPIYATVNVIDWSSKVSETNAITLAVFNSARKQPADVSKGNVIQQYTGSENTVPFATAKVTAQTTYVSFRLAGAGDYQIVAYYDNATTSAASPVTPMFTGFFFDYKLAEEATARFVSTTTEYGVAWQNSPYGTNGYIVLGGDSKFYSNLYVDNVSDRMPATVSSDALTAIGRHHGDANKYLTVEGKVISSYAPVDQWAVCSQVWGTLPESWAGLAIASSLYKPNSTESTAARFNSGWASVPANDASIIMHKRNEGELYVTLYVNNIGGVDDVTDITVLKGAKLVPHSIATTFEEFYQLETLEKTTVTKVKSYVTFKLTGTGYFQFVATKGENGKQSPMPTAMFFDNDLPMTEESKADNVTGTEWEGVYGNDGYIVLDYDNAATDDNLKKIAYTKGIYTKDGSAYTGKVGFTKDSTAYDATKPNAINVAPEWKASDTMLAASDALVSKFGMNTSMYEYKMWLDGGDAGNGDIYLSNMLKKPGYTERVAVRTGGRNNANEGYIGFAFTATEKSVANGGMYVTIYHNNSADGYKDNVNFNVKLFKEYHSTTLENNRPKTEAVQTIEVANRKNTHFYATLKITTPGDYAIYVEPDNGKARGNISAVFFDKTEPVANTDGSYRITYVVENGEKGDNPETYNYSRGVASFAPAVTSDNSKTFKGWYQSSAFGESKRVESIPAGMNVDITLYAKFMKNASITYVVGDGTNSAENPASVESGVAVTLKDPVPPEHYIFDGWYTSADFAADTKVVGGVLTVSDDVTLYAKYAEIAKLTITYVLDGGVNDPANSDSFYSGEGVAELKPATKAGYTFEGWFMDEDFDDEVSSIPASVKENVTLYAKFTKNAVIGNITYVLDGGTNATTNPSTYEEGVAVILADATKEGYTFGGWYTDSAFTNKVTEISAETTGDITVYAKFTKNTDGEVDDSGNTGDGGNSSGSGSASEKKGCFGSIALGAPAIAMAIVAAVVVLKKKKEN